MFPTMTMTTMTIDDAVMALVGSDAGKEWAGQELSHTQLTSLIERMGWRPSTSEKFSNTPRGLVSRWLVDRRIPLHPRTRRLKFDDLVLATGSLKPTSPRSLERLAMAEQEKVNKRIAMLSAAADHAKQQIAALDRNRDSVVNQAERQIEKIDRDWGLLVNQLEHIVAQLDAAEAEEQRLYDAGDRINTYPRLDDLNLPPSMVRSQTTDSAAKP